MATKPSFKGVGGALHSYCQPHSIGLALGLEIADPCLIVFLHASLRLLAIRPTAKLDQHLGTPQRLVTHGPSPRAWGSPLIQAPHIFRGRSIPTCVGLTCVVPVWVPVWAVHPHVRGAHILRSSVIARRTGPSPRAWGSQRGSAADTALPRSIPTCVGLTSSSRAVWWSRSVHPHVRGAHPVVGVGVEVGVGPSPRAWGSPRRSRCAVLHCRSIPTCVGLTATTSGDHTPAAGPSPRAWGSLGHQGLRLGVRRSIPTCVGLTGDPPSFKRSTTVHPHVRGAHQRKPPRMSLEGGPSPRAWGSPKSPPGGADDPAVHPHVRGAHVRVKDATKDITRSIPTCVGLTRSERPLRR
ncbi:hypothetical protein Tfu_1584 [Thermobifida fusca YX]|nr:hypothetical protein Tfu_1584 [Thermobifida fusca YX]